MSFAQPFRDYEILDRVGAGAMGTVFKARHKKLGRIVALKVLRPSLARDERYVDRLKREARIVAALNHRNIVTGYDLGEENGYHYFVMEFIEGKSLRGLLGEWGIFSEARVLDVAIQVAAALDHAYQRGVIHRDVKPGNILIDEAGVVKLTDMGLAKGPADMALTRDGATVGTPQYISPEQAKNPQDVDVRSDLYSLGATLYHMATGQPPFKGDSMAEVITKVLHEAPIVPRLLNPQLSEGLALVIRKLMAKNLRLRYQTPRELLDDLERVRRDQLPDVDESRLSAGEVDEPARVLFWSLVVGGASVALLLAVWFGMQLRSDSGGRGSPDDYVARLQKDLAAQQTLGLRVARLRQAMAEAPASVRRDIDAAMRRVEADLQQQVDALAAELGAQNRAELLEWIADPLEWPTVKEFENGRIARLLFERTGMLQDQMPGKVELRSLTRVRDDIERLVKLRDEGLASSFRHYVDVVLPLLEEESLRSGNFTGAARVWTNGHAQFYNGRQRPLPERLPELQRQQAQQLFERSQQGAMVRIDAAEQAVVAAMVQEVDESVAAIRAAMELDGEPADLMTAAERLREAVNRVYPASARFRPAADPWPRVTAELRALEQELQLHVLARQRRRAEATIELAWRAFCHGDAAAGLAVLGAPDDDPAELAELMAGHRRALGAAGRVGEALLRALQRATEPLPGHPRNGSVTVALRVTGGAVPRLEAQPPGGSWRPAQLTEFDFADLWERAVGAGGAVLDQLRPEDREQGRYVLALVSDDVAAVPEPGGEHGRFLIDAVWPIIVAVRGGGGQEGVDRALMFRRVREAWQRARDQGDPGLLGQLAAAIEQWLARFAGEASGEERKVVAAASRWLDRERDRLERLAELRELAPAGALVEVVDDGDERRAEVVMNAAQLQGKAEDRWQLEGDRLVFAGGVQSVAEVARRRLHIDTGLRDGGRDSGIWLDVLLPSSDHGQRIYLLQFRGVAVAIVATADDRVLAAFIDGDPQRQDHVLAAVRRAQARLLATDPQGVPAPRVIPGGVHRLSLQIDTSPLGARARARLAFDDDPATRYDDERTTLCEGHVQIDRASPPTALLFPLQDITVTRARLLAVGF